MGDILLENIFKKSKIIKSFNLENCKIQYQNIIQYPQWQEKTLLSNKDEKIKSMWIIRKM